MTINATWGRMTMVAAMALGIGAVGCAGGTSVVRATGPSSIQRTAGVQGPHVPAGTEFTIRMNDPLSTQESRIGQTFTATLASPLRATDGTVLAEPGATVTGRVAELDAGRRPLIRLEFTSIETARGSVPLSVRVRDADRVTFRGDERVAMPPVRRNTGVAVFEPTFGSAYEHSYGSTAGGYGTPVYQGAPREAILPARASVRLQLTRPIVTGNRQVARAW